MNFTISVDGLELSVVETGEVLNCIVFHGILPEQLSSFR
jgi:hypothetical protein